MMPVTSPFFSKLHPWPRATQAGRLRRRVSAFTLIELLVSIAILTTGIVVVLEAFQTSLVALQETRESLFADLLTRQRMSAIEEGIKAAPGEMPESGKGSFSGAFRDYRWSQYVKAEAPPGLDADMPEGRIASVSINVWRQRSRAARALNIAYFIPEPSE